MHVCLHTVDIVECEYCICAFIFNNMTKLPVTLSIKSCNIFGLFVGFFFSVLTHSRAVVYLIIHKNYKLIKFNARDFKLLN